MTISNLFLNQKLACQTNISDSDLTDKAHKTAFSTLKLKTSRIYREFKFQDKVIQVSQYLPEREKQDIIEIAYQKAVIASNFNPLLFNVYLLLNIVYSYTNLTFTDEQRKDELKLYDIIVTSGLMDKILCAMPICEKQYYRETIFDYVETKMKLDYSAFGLVNSGIGAFNKFSSVISEKLSNVDENTIQALLDNLPNMLQNNATT